MPNCAVDVHKDLTRVHVFMTFALISKMWSYLAAFHSKLSRANKEMIDTSIGVGGGKKVRLRLGEKFNYDRVYYVSKYGPELVISHISVRVFPHQRDISYFAFATSLGLYIMFQ